MTRRCANWAKGSCTLGETCPFLHTGMAGVHVACRHYVKGLCHRGDDCDFKHDPLLSQHRIGQRTAFNYDQGYMYPTVRRGYVYPTVRRGYVYPTVQQGYVDPMLYTTVQGGYMMMGEQPDYRHNLLRQLSYRRRAVPEESKTSRICRHWMKSRGNCIFKQTCEFRHPNLVDFEQPVEEPAEQTSLCRHWAKGECRLGNACHFNHPMPEKQTTVFLEALCESKSTMEEMKEKTEQTEDPSSKTEQTKEKEEEWEKAKTTKPTKVKSKKTPKKES